jgi:transcriptional regulator with XRE-family HTH domain
MSWGDHVRNHRLSLGMFQREVAELLGLSVDGIASWEKNRTQPAISQIPKVVDFLGYQPFELDDSTFAGRLKAYRLLYGLSHKKVGALLGTDPSNIGRWESGKGRPSKDMQVRLDRLLSDTFLI